MGSSRPFQSDSYRNPRGARFRSEPGSGSGSGSGMEGERPRPLSDAYSGWMAWAQRELPSEHAPFAAVAAAMLKRNGTKPTAENVLARLEDQGRSMEQLS